MDSIQHLLKNVKNNEVIMKNTKQRFNGLSQTIQYLLIRSAFAPSVFTIISKRRKEKCANVEDDDDDDDNGNIFVLRVIQHTFTSSYLLTALLDCNLKQKKKQQKRKTSAICLVVRLPIESNQSKWETDVVVLNSMIENRS